MKPWLLDACSEGQSGDSLSSESVMSQRGQQKVLECARSLIPPQHVERINSSQVCSLFDCDDAALTCVS